MTRAAPVLINIPMTESRRQIAVARGTTLFEPGQSCPGLILLAKGNIKVTLTAANGREVVLYRVHPGDMCLQTFACLVEGRVYSAEGLLKPIWMANLCRPTASAPGCKATLRSATWCFPPLPTVSANTSG